MPMLALAFASAVCVGLVLARVISTGNIRYVFLAWNLCLAWLPLVFALLAHETFQQQSARNWRFAAPAGLWLLFFPNAPYIFTDLIHLSAQFRAHFWVDLLLILSCALTGLVLGFVSLFLMQGVVRRLLGGVASWVFVAGVAGLSGFGVWLGRFLRFNSWDVLFRPMEVYHGLGSWVTNPFRRGSPMVFPALFGTFVFITYLMLYALTHLRQAPPAAAPAGNAKAGKERVRDPLGAVSG